MADRSIVVRLRAQVADFKKGMDESAKAADKARAAIEATEDPNRKAIRLDEERKQAIRSLENGMMALGTATVAGVGLAVAKFADFDKQMSAVAATGQDARDNLDGLRDAAMAAGADTAYSATEAASAVTELAKAGISASDIMGGGLAGSLDLAASEGMDLAESAGLVSTAMQQFGLSGSKATHVADLLAAGAGKAMGSAADLGAALKQSGLVAASTGLTIEETTAGLAAFAQQGLIGSDAGTSFKTMLQALSNPSKEARALMDDLGISLYNPKTGMADLEYLAGNLATGLADMSVEQRNATLATIFGSDAVRAANVLFKEGADGIAEWTAAVNDQGYAAEAAARLTDNLSGDVERLGGALDTILLKSGSGVNDVLRGIVQGAEGVVDAIGRIPTPILAVVTGLAGAGGLGLVGVAAIGKVHRAVTDGSRALQDMGVISEGTASKMGRSLGSVAKAAGVVAAALGALKVAGSLIGDDAQTTDVQEMTNALIRYQDSVVEAAAMSAAAGISIAGSTNEMAAQLDAAFTKRGGSGWLRTADDLNGIADAAQQLKDYSSGAGQVIMGLGRAVGAVADPAQEARDAFDNFDLALAGLVQAGNLDAAAAGAEQVRAALTEAGFTTAEQDEILHDYGVALEAAAIAAEKTADGQGDLGDATGGTTGEIEDQTDALKDNVEWQRKAAGIVLSVRDAQVGLEASIDDATEALKKNGRTLDITTEKGRANRSALDDIADAGWDLIESMRESGATAEQLSAQMGTNRAAFIKAAEAFGMSTDEAAALADQLRLIPESFSLMVDANTDPAKGALSDVVTEIDEAEGTVTVNGDDGPVTNTLDAVTATINATTGSLTIAGKDGQALDVLFGVKRTVDATTGAVTITGKDAEGREKVYTFTSWANSQSASIAVTADTSAATRALNSIRSQFFGSNSFGVLKPTFAGGLVGLAGGGRVPGTPPANPFADNLVASVDGGRSHIAIRSGEYVEPQPAVDYYGLAVMDAIRSRRIPKEVLRGYASGGEVGTERRLLPGPRAAAQGITVTATVGDVTARLSDRDIDRIVNGMLAASQRVAAGVLDVRDRRVAGTASTPGRFS